MFLTKKVWPSEVADRDQAGAAGISGRSIGQITIFLVAWFVTYNRAYLSGDDINSFKDSNYGVPLFLPQFSHSWIPNRVMDMYGRNLLLHIFDMIYFPAKSLFGTDFFFAFKLFNATIFAIFLCFVYGYLVDQIIIQELFLEGRRRRDNGVLVSLFVAFITLTIFPWTNVTQMVCYQVPAFLCFVVLAELFKLMPGFSVQAQAGIPLPWLMTLAFISAFSLEAYSAILLAAIVFAWVLNCPLRSREVWRSPVFIVSCLLVVFCVAALFVTARYALRPAFIEKASPVRQMEDFFLANKRLSHDARLYCVVLIAGVAGPLLLLAALPFCQRFVRGDAKIAGLIAPVLQKFSLTRWTLFFLIVLFPTMIVVSLTSLETDYNYFSLTSYPWGSMLLIAAFFAVPAVAMPVIWLSNENFLGETVRIFLMMMFISGAAIHAMRQSEQYYDNSEKILNAYHAAQKSAAPVFDTGLALNSIPLQIRPFPTAQGPTLFIKDYPAFFKKYYGVNTTTTLFK